MNPTIQIEAKVMGQKKPIIDNWAFSLPPQAIESKNDITLHDIIAWVVRAEVDAFHQRQHKRRFARILTRQEIEDGVRKGKIDSGDQEHEEQQVDAQAAVTTALEAFEDGLYYVFVNEVQIQSLEEVLDLHADSKMTFLRLVPLAGG